MGNADNSSAAGAAPFDQAAEAIAAGSAEAYALWVLLSDEHERDGFALKPMPWEGPGEYQHVAYKDGRDGLVRVPVDRTSLPTTSRARVKVRITSKQPADKDAAASAMLAALKAIKDDIGVVKLGGDNFDRYEAAKKQVRAAIAAAEAAGIKEA